MACIELVQIWTSSQLSLTHSRTLSLPLIPPSLALLPHRPHSIKFPSSPLSSRSPSPILHPLACSWTSPISLKSLPLVCRFVLPSTSVRHSSLSVCLLGVVTFLKYKEQEATNFTPPSQLVRGTCVACHRMHSFTHLFRLDPERSRNTLTKRLPVLPHQDSLSRRTSITRYL